MARVIMSVTVNPENKAWAESEAKRTDASLSHVINQLIAAARINASKEQQ